MHRPHSVARFTPLRQATRFRRALLFSLGPLLWVAAIVVVAIGLKRGSSVEIALIVLGGSLLVSLAILLPMRWLRIRSDREGEA